MVAFKAFVVSPASCRYPSSKRRDRITVIRVGWPSRLAWSRSGFWSRLWENAPYLFSRNLFPEEDHSIFERHDVTETTHQNQALWSPLLEFGNYRRTFRLTENSFLPSKTTKNAIKQEDSGILVLFFFGKLTRSCVSIKLVLVEQKSG